MSDLEAFARHLAPLAEPDPVLAHAARGRVFDTLGAAAIGLATPEGQLTARIFAAALDAPAIAVREELCRALVAATRATEIDDIDITCCVTPGSVVVPVALTNALAHDRAAALLLPAVAAGYEAMRRLGRALNGARLIYRGIWPTQVTAAVAAAATTAVQLELDPTATVAALGLALQGCQPLDRQALVQPGLRQFSLGAAAADGVLAARAAAAGLAPGPAVLAEFAARLERLAAGACVDPAVFTATAAQPAVCAVETKPFPTSRQALASVLAFRQLLPLAAGQVQAIRVQVPAAYLGMVNQPERPVARLQSMLGVQYALALAAELPGRLDDVLRHDLPWSRAIAEWMGKVRVEADADLDERFPGAWGSRVTVTLNSGESRQAEVIERPATADSLAAAHGLAKFARLAAASGLARADAAAESLGAAIRQCLDAPAAGTAAAAVREVVARGRALALATGSGVQ